MAVSSTTGGLRTGVCLSTDRPQNPYNGQVIYETDTNRTLVWDNSAWVVIADASTTGFPTSLDTNSVGAIEALQAKVGVDGSDVTSSLDYKVDVALPGGLLDFNSQTGDITISTGYTQLASVTFTVPSNRYVLFTFVIPNIDLRSTTNRIDYYISDSPTNASFYQRIITEQTNTANSHANGSLIHPVSSGANTFYLFANTSTGTARIEGSGDRLRQFAAFDVGPWI